MDPLIVTRRMDDVSESESMSFSSLFDSSDEHVDLDLSESSDVRPKHQTCLLDSRGRKTSFLLQESGDTPEVEETLEVTVQSDDEEEDEQTSPPKDPKEPDETCEKEINKVVEAATSKVIHNTFSLSSKCKNLSEISKRIDQSLDESEKTIEEYTAKMARFLEEMEQPPGEQSTRLTDSDSGIDIDFTDVITDQGENVSDNDPVLILDIDVPEDETSDSRSVGVTEEFDTEVLIGSVSSYAICQSEQIKDSSSFLSVVVQDSQKLLTVPRDDVAQNIPPSTPVPVGSRVLAKSQGNWILGVTAEPSKLINRFRYLVFLNDGQSVYVKNEDIRTFLDTTESDLEVDGFTEQDQSFIKKYLATYMLNGFPETPLKKLKEGDIIKLNADDKWWTANVLEVDSSIMKVSYSNGSQEEWIFRGSHRIGGKTEATKVQENETRGSFAKKSTSRKRNLEIPPTNGTANTEVSPSAAADCTIFQVFHDPVPGLKFVPHDCSPACVSRPEHKFNSAKVTGQILLIPLQWGWRRQVSKHSNNGFTKVRFAVFYSR